MITKPREYLIAPMQMLRCPERQRCWAEVKSVIDPQTKLVRIVGYWCTCTHAVEHGRADDD